MDGLPKNHTLPYGSHDNCYVATRLPVLGQLQNLQHGHHWPGARPKHQGFCFACDHHALWLSFKLDQLITCSDWLWGVQGLGWVLECILAHNGDDLQRVVGLRDSDHHSWDSWCDVARRPGHYNGCDCDPVHGAPRIARGNLRHHWQLYWLKQRAFGQALLQDDQRPDACSNRHNLSCNRYGKWADCFSFHWRWGGVPHNLKCDSFHGVLLFIRWLARLLVGSYQGFGSSEDSKFLRHRLLLWYWNSYGVLLCIEIRYGRHGTANGNSASLICTTHCLLSHFD